MEKVYKSLQESFKPWVHLNKNNLINDLEFYYNENYITNKIVKCIVINNRLSSNINHLDFIFQPRAKIMINCFKTVLEKMRKKKIRLNNFVFYFTVNDYSITDKLPIFAFSKPINEEGILMPDWTFINANDSGVKGNWDNVIEAIKNTEIGEKKNIIFFQGRNTSRIFPGNNVRNMNKKYKKDIRKSIETLSQTNNKFLIYINKPKVPSLEWKSYKYLLDLPGAYPWSVRFKELLMMRSLVIKVDTKIPWVNFYSPLLIPDVDYVRITYDNNDSIEKIGKDVYNKLVEKYNYMEKHPDYVNKIIENGYNKINKLTMKCVIEYVILMFKIVSNLLSVSRMGNKTKSKKIYNDKKTKKIIKN